MTTDKQVYTKPNNVGYTPPEVLDYKSKLLCEIKIKPCGQAKYMLGKFVGSSMPKGFLVELDHDPDPLDSVVSQIASLDTAGTHKLMLIIENYGNTTVAAEIRQLC